jgi:proteasome lid subunit RPN8/RPN11
MIREWLGDIVAAVRGQSTPSPDDSPPPLPSLLVPDEVCAETARGLRSHSPPHEDHEGVVYWAGMTDDELGVKLALAVIVPEADTTPGSYDVTPVANAAVVEAVHAHDLELIATVHSHPGEMTSHSRRDSEETQLPHDGYYSVVVPNYARDGVRPFTDCGVHVYRDGGFHELDANTVQERVRAIPSPPTYVDTRDQ